MRNFGFVLLVAGIAGFVYCSSQLQGLPPLPADLALGDYMRNDAGRFELGRYFAAGAALIGLIMAFFPKGR
jgi:hypothetical protein